MIYLKNEFLSVKIKKKGAELCSLVSNEIEYIWQADPSFWGKSSPVLFPIVGGLKDHTYFFERKRYCLPRHGFAREMDFEIEYQDDQKAIFLLLSNDETIKAYPFIFALRIIYKLQDSLCEVTYNVENLGKNELYFSIGAHPAFNVPIDPKLSYEDYYLEFDKEESLEHYPLTKEGLIKTQSQKISNVGSKLQLNKALFYADALVFKNLNSNSIKIKSDLSNHSLKISFPNFPYFGIWAAKDADFVCLEPWCGIADNENTNQDLTQKEGIEVLLADKTFDRSWSIEVN